MKDNTTATLATATHKRFLRSIFLERDWYDPSALDSYTYTLQAAQSLQRLGAALKKSSTLRAWRITGDYGSGKSSFSLLLANILAKRTKEIPKYLREEIRETLPELLKPSQPKLLPVLVTGSRTGVAEAILRALLRTLSDAEVHGTFSSKLHQLLDTSVSFTDEDVLQWIKRTHTHLIKTQKADGLCLIIDEAGKFLEFAALHPHKEDIYLLQRLAELAARSGQNPIVIISVLHQGISSYSADLSKAQQNEWEKVAGRYEEIVWHYPVEQTVMLIEKALSSSVSKKTASLLKVEMKAAIQQGWFGININKAELIDKAAGAFPLHPTVVPILVKLFANFGQNERSLFSFLLGNEPFGLQDFIQRSETDELYRLHHLYDYAKTSFGSRLSIKSYHWKAIEALINRFTDEDIVTLRLLKTIGIINLIDSADLIASKEIVQHSLGEEVSTILKKLEKQHYIHYRGLSGGYCVWPNTSVNLQEAYELAKRTLPATEEIKSLLKAKLESRPLVARRHYINTGNLRYFELRYVEIDQLQTVIKEKGNSDGCIVVPLCFSEKDIQNAIIFSKSLTDAPATLMVIPNSLQECISFLQEVLRWEWIERSVPELKHDRFAREEVTRQLNIAQYQLQRTLQTAVGLHTLHVDNTITCFLNGHKLSGITTGKRIAELLSQICDNVFYAAPKLKNELINRRELSSAGASARLRLCERLFEFSSSPYLGMDPATHPPEMSMYLSVLQEAGLHQQEAASTLWKVDLPAEDYDATHCNVLPAMRKMHEVLNNRNNERVQITALFDALEAAPYGVRDGVIPLLIAVFAVIHEQELAFYEDGSFVSRMTGSTFLRLIKAPETFEIQYYPITGVRNLLFEKIVHDLEFGGKKGADTVDLLDVVKPLMVFTAGLPDYAKHTTHLSPQTLAVRQALQTAKDPIKLLFTDLPFACGIKDFDVRRASHQTINTFVAKLKESVDELRAVYPNLLKFIEHSLWTAFKLGNNASENRASLAGRAQGLAPFVNEIGLKSFCLRLADTVLVRDLWVESLGNLLCSMPPAKWRDKDYLKLESELNKLVQQFMRVEATLYKKLQKGAGEITVRVALTRPTGEERDQVLFLKQPDMQRMVKLEHQLKKLLAEHGHIGMAAASEVLWQMMEGHSE